MTSPQPAPEDQVSAQPRHDVIAAQEPWESVAAEHETIMYLMVDETGGGPVPAITDRLRALMAQARSGGACPPRPAGEDPR